jgi:hypothetical protein
MMCDVIGPGRLTIVFGRSAGLGNPGHSGTYTADVSRQRATLASQFVVQAG